MLTSSDHASEPFHRKEKIIKEASTIRKFPITQLIFHHPRTWIFLTILIFQVFVILTVRYLLIPCNERVLPSSSPSVSYSELDYCPHGRVFVYNLPPEMNSNLIRDCHNLSPWGSRCSALDNDGFGIRAPGIQGIIPEELAPAWYSTDQFVLEIIFHQRILNHRCRTSDPDVASAFYIPFYAGLSLEKHLWSRSTARDRDRLSETMLIWVKNQPYWNRSGGWDHFITLGRISWDFRRSRDDDWGSSLIHMPLMRNVTRLLIERNTWDYFDVGIPYPTAFHPQSPSDLEKWQIHVQSSRRKSLFSIAGAKRSMVESDFRKLLFTHCTNNSDVCRTVDCSEVSPCTNGIAGSTILKIFLDSDFCLQPPGDSFTRRSIFDCMVAGAIPVFFWHRTAYLQYEWFLPSDMGSYSVFIDRDAVKGGVSIRGVLESYSNEKVRKMREKVIEIIPNFVYVKPQEGLGTVKDAFDVAIEGVLKRVKEQENGYKW